MRIAFLSWRILALALMAAPPGLVAARADPLTSNDAEPVLPDPTPHDSHNFPPAIATSGAADPGRKAGSVAAPRPAACKAASPCAVPPAPLAHVAPPPPANPG